MKVCISDQYKLSHKISIITNSDSVVAKTTNQSNFKLSSLQIILRQP